MSDTYSYEVLEPGGHARLVGNVLDRISEASANPASAVGSSRAILGDPETASWMQRTTSADGAALIEAVYGNTLQWNQLYDKSKIATTTTNGITFTVNADGSIKASGTATAMAVITLYGIPVVAGHKYLFKGCPSGGSDSTYYSYLTGAGFPYGGHIDTGAGDINVPSTTGITSYVLARVESGQTVDNLVFRPQLFDLTQMFGSGNEPATVAEFEALYPDAYYPYDAGSLLPVRMEGVETVGFNQWDEEYLYGQYNAYTGEYEANTSRLCSKYPISIAPNTAYYVYTNASKYNSWIIVVYYDANMNYLSYASPSVNRTFTTPTNAHYMHFGTSDNWGGAAYDHDICINLSDPARNGEYEPHWSSQRTIPVATYFPDGMRSAGSVYDELRADAAMTRVGAVDLGTLTWTRAGNRWRSADLVGIIAMVTNAADMPNIIAEKYEAIPATGSLDNNHDAITVIVGGPTTGQLYTYADDSTPSPSGLLHYALATPTTTPIDPPLPLSYRVGAGGTERVMVASGTTSAPPVFVTRYPLDPADLAASIAPRESATAEANHAVGDLVMLGFTLCKVTTSIARGETITIGTNVTRTSVAAEIAALS